MPLTSRNEDFRSPWSCHFRRHFPGAVAFDLATITGISDAKVWTPTGYKAETEPANA